MNDLPHFSLIDVMRGIRALGIGAKLPAAHFRFLLNLILEADKLAFQNPLLLTNAEAKSLAGVNSTQGLLRLRKSLTDFRIYGRQIVKIKKRSGWQKRLISYQIDYGFMVSQTIGNRGKEVRLDE